MEIWLGITGAFLFITLAWAYKATSHSLELLAENERLKRRVEDLQLAGKMALDIFKLTEKAMPPTFDTKTSSLIRLAVSNSNENEARSAAVQACQRIHKQINKR
jgi:hypothetical protein